MKTIVVTETPDFWAEKLSGLSTLVFQTPHAYLTEYKCDEKKQSLRIINLSPSYDYQSVGYYVSLLGQARGDKVMPSVLTIQDFNTRASKMLIEMQLKEEIQTALKTLSSDKYELSVYFGKNLAKHYDQLCQKFHSIIPMPLFRVYFKKNSKGIWFISRIAPICSNDILPSHHEFVAHAAQAYFEKIRIVPFRQKKTACSVAMLIDRSEAHPPSNKAALEKFIKAGDKLGMDVVIIQKDDLKTLPQYDGLFIRATTAVDNYTYQFSRYALAEGLVTIDDAVSILRCANKVFLADLLRGNHISTPNTTILFKKTWRQQIATLGFPLIIKQPDSAFSLGVVKVENTAACLEKVADFFEHSELLIAQAYMPSEFDWRIGVLNQEPLFACQYFMAKNHWQIYNWESTQEKEGNFKTLPLSEVPSTVLQAAIKASKPIGDGLYGVDIKYMDGTAYVIEVNDNPNIDHKIEDAILGDELYLKIMGTFLDRIRRKFHAH